MDYLTHKEDIRPGSIVKIYVGRQFEGWARLLEPAGDLTTFIGKNAVYEKQRWTVEFVTEEEIPPKTKTSERWNQKFLSGVRTHRIITNFGEISWDTYVEKHGKPYETRSEFEPEDEDTIEDDFNGVF